MDDGRLAYVIADYRTPELATAAVGSIRLRRPGSEIVTVNAEGLSYSQALNGGIRGLASQPEIVCCLNADVEMLQRDDPVLALFDGDPRLVIVGPRQMDGQNRCVHGGIVPHEGGTEWDLDLRHRCWHWDMDRPDAIELTSGTFPVPMVSGAVFYVRRDTLAFLGGWPEWTRFYYEDAWLCYIARHKDLGVVYTGSVTWRHFHEGSPASRGWRMEAQRVARERFILECGRAGVPLRVGLAEAA